MEHPFFPTTTTRAEALRWLTIAEKLLSARDLMGSKSFATRARDSDPTLTPADQILAVADTLLAGDRRIGNSNQHDWYAILRLTPQQGRDSELIASQYRNLALILNPQKNRFPFAEQAFRLVVDAWSVLSNPSSKSAYDKELAFYLQPHQQPQPSPFSNAMPALNPNFVFFGGSSSSSSGGGTGGAAQSGAVHFSQAQVHSTNPNPPPQVEPARVPQSFMSFTSGSNLAFGGGSNKEGPEGYEGFSGNVAVATQEPVNHKGQQSQLNYSNVGDKIGQNANVGDKTGQNANVSENVGGNEAEVERSEEQQERVDGPVEDDGSTFWTACPYCYHMYEYPGMYADCTLRCQNCKKAFQGVAIPSPPPIVEGQEGYFCCWGFLPLGFSMEHWEKNKGAASSWTPFSPMFTTPQAWNGNSSNATKRRGPPKSSAPRVYIDDDDDEDEVYLEISDSSDDDWRDDLKKKKKKARNVKGKGTSGGTPNKNAKKAQVDKGKNVTVVEDGLVPPVVVEAPTSNNNNNNKTVVSEPIKKGGGVNARKQPGRSAKNKLDLNVEFSNEAEEPAPRVNQGSGPTRGEDDNIEGIGFFEGLDEFLSSLPILNVVGDDKVVKAA